MQKDIVSAKVLRRYLKSFSLCQNQAAGIGDVKESKLESDHFWRMWQGALVELERAEHRAEVLGRALAIMRGKGLISCVVDDYISQAEKELAEEKKE